MKQKMNFVIYLLLQIGIFLTFLSSCKKDDNTDKDILKDVDDNVYHTVTIGTQVWMKENLKTTKYNDGTAIPNVTDDAIWGSLATCAYCWYGNDAGTYGDTYGALYNWYTVASDNPKNVSPAGWHVPSVTDWETLTNYLGSSSVAGGKLKETGTTHWYNPNTGATNETGFTALPGGYRDDQIAFFGLGFWSFMWSSSDDFDTYSWYIMMFPDTNSTGLYDSEKVDGLSVRCVRNL
jgi:uncharacterized protein (TIGR02145 family)